MLPQAPELDAMFEQAKANPRIAGFTFSFEPSYKIRDPELKALSNMIDWDKVSSDDMALSEPAFADYPGYLKTRATTQSIPTAMGTLHYLACTHANYKKWLCSLVGLFTLNVVEIDTSIVQCEPVTAVKFILESMGIFVLDVTSPMPRPDRDYIVMMDANTFHNAYKWNADKLIWEPYTFNVRCVIHHLADSMQSGQSDARAMGILIHRILHMEMGNKVFDLPESESMPVGKCVVDFYKEIRPRTRADTFTYYYDFDVSPMLLNLNTIFKQESVKLAKVLTTSNSPTSESRCIMIDEPFIRLCEKYGLKDVFGDCAYDATRAQFVNIFKGEQSIVTITGCAGLSLAKLFNEFNRRIVGYCPRPRFETITSLRAVNSMQDPSVTIADISP